MSAITTHVLDTSIGRPATGVAVRLERLGTDGEWKPLGEGHTDADGRLRELLPVEFEATRGEYRLTFETGAYFQGMHVGTFFPRAVIHFELHEKGGRYHVPLLLSPFGYSTYRGS